MGEDPRDRGSVRRDVDGPRVSTSDGTPRGADPTRDRSPGRPGSGDDPMLDQVAKIELSERLWNSIPSRTTLPDDDEEFFAATGAASASGEFRRQYIRIHMRETALLVH